MRLWLDRVKLTLVPALLVSLQPVSAQQTPTPTPTPVPAAPQKTIADFAREQRGEKEKPQTVPMGAQPKKSLSEVAAELRSKRHLEVKLTDKNATELLKELEEITDFASSDTGFAERARVKHQIVGEEDVKRYWSAVLSDSAEAQRLARSEIVLKKFGYLPQDFTLRKFLVDNAANGLGGFYDPRTKTMNLVNWVGLENQRPIMAHELTHALQDQNFDLMNWQRNAPRRVRRGDMRVDPDEAQESDARRAVIEGQAMLVYFDYLLKPYGRTLADTPSAMDFINARLTETYDTSFVVHNAPLLFKESAFFPYREGLLFELELLKKGGTHMAFADVFAHPPVDTHQILDPKAYLADEKVAPVVIPNVNAVLGPNFEAYDVGTIGQLDVRVMSQQFGSDNDMFTITPGWSGGSYIAAKRTGTAGNLTTADIGLLYVSRWKDAEAAQRFAELYRKSLSKRLTVTDEQQLDAKLCVAKECALWATRVATNEGPVFIEIWPNHTVFISHTFTDQTVAQLRSKVLVRGSETDLAGTAPDLSQRLQTLPGFEAFRREIEQRLVGPFKPEQ